MGLVLWLVAFLTEQGARRRAPRQKRGAGGGYASCVAASRGGASRRRVDAHSDARRCGAGQRAGVLRRGGPQRRARLPRTRAASRRKTGYPSSGAVNVLAPYVLTALMRKPNRLIYLSSGMHLGGDLSLNDPQYAERRWNGAQAYSDTKLHDVLLAFGVARRCPDVASNVVSPGWVATHMGWLRCA